MRMPGTLATGLAAGLAIVTVGLAIGAAFMVMGSPAEQRLRQLDERRVEDLRAVSSAIDLYWQRHQQLPASLDGVEREQGRGVVRQDPITNERYEYRVDAPRAYSVCARFDRESLDDSPWLPAFPHGVGRQCFARAPQPR
jgi:hypothetical protein